MNKNREKIRRGAGLVLFALIVAGLMGVSTAQAALITTSLTKPSDNVLAQNTTDGTSPIATEALELATATKYAIGQSFTTTTAWNLDKISVQYRSFSPFMDSDATVKLVLFAYDSATFDSEAWGTYTTAASGTALNVLYTEVFGATFADVDKTWLTFDLTTNQSLAAGTQYGFALWASNPSGGATSGTSSTKARMELYYGGNTYTGGDYIRATSTGNTVATTDLNFVLQAVPEPATIGMLGMGALITLLLRRKIMS